MDPYRRELCIKGHRSDLPSIIDFVEDSAAEAGVDPGIRFDLQLAVEEACTNVIEHAYHDQGGEFEVCFETRDRDVRITIHDHGQPFDPARVRRPDLSLPLEDRRVGGLGLFLIEKLMDEVSFSFTVNGNTLVMIKHNAVSPGRWADAA
ncbi:MAG TPA: ATP-binding protein [Anaerolineae bacterium]